MGLSDQAAMALAKGEALIREEQFVALTQLMEDHFPLIDRDKVVAEIEQWVENGNIETAIKLWYFIFKDYNDTKVLAGGLLRLGLQAVWHVGAIGGWIYLIQLLFN